MADAFKKTLSFYERVFLFNYLLSQIDPLLK